MEQRDAYQLLQWYQQMGINLAVAQEPLDRRGQVMVKPPVKSVVTSVISTDLRREVASCQTLAELRQLMMNFDGCDLKKGATQLVFSDGNPQSSLMLIGEAPGAEEDKQGRPFVGLSGQLLDRMLATIGLDRRSLYITNILPWRPPGNRQPTASEIALCLPFIEKHIALVAPRLLLFLGGVAAKTLLQTSEGIVRLRGHWQDYSNPYTAQVIPALATFHPAYLLRSPGQKALVWQDLLQVQAAAKRQLLTPDDR
ncbi:MAG: uracil-DNA glycosylase [Alphaproteobacteria bacterium]